MSFSSRLTLVTSCVATAGIIGYVHFKQYYDRDQLHQGVIRDVERQQRRKVENLYVLRQQIGLTKELKLKQEAEEKTKDQL